jgi:hypothetical protein
LRLGSSGRWCSQLRRLLSLSLHRFTLPRNTSRIDNSMLRQARLQGTFHEIRSNQSLRRSNRGPNSLGQSLLSFGTQDNPGLLSRLYDHGLLSLLLLLLLLLMDLLLPLLNLLLLLLDLPLLLLLQRHLLLLWYLLLLMHLHRSRRCSCGRRRSSTTWVELVVLRRGTRSGRHLLLLHERIRNSPSL